MAARLRATHQEDVRKKIQASQIINRLTDYFNGKIELSTGQIQSAKILLDKSVSNAPIELSGPDGGPMRVENVPWLQGRTLG